LPLLAACAPQENPAVISFEPQRDRDLAVEAPRLEGDGSLAALTAEVRQLRGAVEDLARSQTRTQALGVYLSAQQGRLQQADAQLAAARQELDSATAVRDKIEAQLTELLAAQPRATLPEKRAEIEDAIKGMQSEQVRVDRTLQQAQRRESDLSEALRSEETRWNELIARLEALAR